jgi:hemerythrin-like domain-containing protein
MEQQPKGGAMPRTPTDVLREEHELVLMVVAAMEREVASIERDDRVNADRVANMIDFTKNFTDGCHHTKEEKLLFPLLEERDAAAGGPVSVMLSEHDAGREAVRAITGALPEVETSAAARRTVAENLGLYAQLLRLHINKENTVLFPLADRLLGELDQKRLAAEFERVEEEETGAGVHERYHAMAHALHEA